MARGKGGAGGYRDEEPRKRYTDDYERNYQRARYDDRDDYNDYDEYEDERYRRPRARKQTRRKKRTWPALLLGCFGGILLVVIAAAIVVFVSLSKMNGSPVSLPGVGSGNGPGSSGGSQVLTKSEDVPVPQTLTAIGQLQVQNPIGNVTITSDPSAQQVTVTALKSAKVANQGDAQAEFNKMQAQAQVTQDSNKNNILTITGNVPVSSSGTLGNTHNDAINLTITLPATILSNGSAAPVLNITTSVGNVQVSGLNGVVTVKDDIGNVTVQQAQLFDGSHLQTGTGDVTFNGSIDTTTNPQANYKFQAEVGNLNVTLPATTNVKLDTNTNAGTITSDFSIPVQSSSGGANYYGPLLSGASPAPTVTLVLDVGSGNVTLHKK